MWAVLLPPGVNPVKRKRHAGQGASTEHAAPNIFCYKNKKMYDPVEKNAHIYVMCLETKTHQTRPDGQIYRQNNVAYLVCK
jgi:hypothetical protein